jgi:histidyl-tRNA synthetase
MSGFRDMLAEQMLPRQEMIEKIRRVYELYGFVPLDTPALERLETLTGKYGPEGEKLMYKFKDHGGRDVALRYDLTVPLSRVVAQYREKLQLPYKRYQVGNVWRGESPQAGRFREFMQFDADVVGSDSPVADAEIVMMMVDTMKELGAEAVVRVNNRLILDALGQKLGFGKEDTKKAITAIDKLEKVGKEKVIEEIKEITSEEKAVGLIEKFISIKGSSEEKISEVEKLLGDTEAGKGGVDNLKKVFNLVREAGYSEEQIKFDQSIARGLDYYTGIVYETTLKDLPGIGSVCSGGRFDKLISVLSGGKVDLPAVGTSVGVDRLFSGLSQLGKLEVAKTKSKVLILNMDDSNLEKYADLATKLRKKGIACEVYYDNAKVGKQIKFADGKGIPYVIFLGGDEIKEGKFSLKDLKSTKQVSLSFDKLVEKLLSN